MEYLYTIHTKLVADKIHFFVKKLMAFPEFNGLADVVVGYGMHTDFEKACTIAGIEDMDARKKLFAEFELQSKPKEVLPVVKKPSVEITDPVNKWLSEIGVVVLN